MAVAPTRADATPTVGRIASLDVSRGVFLVVSLCATGLLAPRPWWWEHARWGSPTPLDHVFPTFVVLSGCGLAFAHRRPVALPTTARRVTVLLVAGLLFNAVMAGSVDLATWRVTGVLQSYAVLVLVAAPAHRVLRTPLAWGLVTAVLTLVTSAAYGWGVPAFCPEGLSRACNPSGFVDPLVFTPAHLYAGGAQGHDPEGLVSVLGLLTTASIGITTGHLLLSLRPGGRGWLRLAAWLSALALLAVVAAELVEPIKRIWTPSFAVIAALPGVLLLTVLYLLLDRRGGPPGIIGAALTWPLVALGRNSLLVYFGSHVVVHVLATTGPSPGLAMLLGQRLLPGNPQAAFLLATLGAWWALACVLHVKRLYVRA